MKEEAAHVRFELEPLPENHERAVQCLMELVRAADNKKLQDVPAEMFKRGWYSIGFLYPGLHPDAALDHGTELSSQVENILGIQDMDPRLLAPYYVESGWPAALAPVAEEAWRLYEAGKMEDDELYCSEAVVAGMCFRNPELAEEVRQQRETQR